MPKFIRPPSKFPQIYATFKAKDKDSEEEVDYVIQELPEGCFDEALDLLISDYLPDETLCACLNFADNPDAVLEARDFWRRKFALNVSIACYKSDGSDLVGVSVLGVVGCDDNDDESESLHSQNLIDVINAVKFITAGHNVYEEYGIDRFLTDFGIVINRNYRLRGIAKEMLKAEIDVAKTLGIKVISSTFTTAGSQKAAEKVGYKEVHSISYEKLGENFPNFNFSKSSAEYAKILDYQIE